MWQSNKRDGGAVQQLCTSQHVLPQYRVGQDEGWDPYSQVSFPVTHRWAGVWLKSWQLWGSSEFVTDWVSNICSLKASVTSPATSVPYETCGGGSAAPLSLSLLMRVSFLLSPGTLKSFLQLFFRFTCPMLCLGARITQWEDSRWLSVGVHQAC